VRLARSVSLPSIGGRSSNDGEDGERRTESCGRRFARERFGVGGDDPCVLVELIDQSEADCAARTEFSVEIGRDRDVSMAVAASSTPRRIRLDPRSWWQCGSCGDREPRYGFRPGRAAARVALMDFACLLENLVRGR
jgi:hypothetical protein